MDTIAAGSAYPARQHAEGEPRYKTVVSPKERGLFMKREDVKAKIPGITDEQLNWLMSENGADINREKTVAEQFKTQFENAQAQLKTAQDGLKAFDGKKTPDEYEAELTKLRGDMQAQADGFAFDSALNTAIMGKKGRSVKAVRALLDEDSDLMELHPGDNVLTADAASGREGLQASISFYPLAVGILPEVMK